MQYRTTSVLKCREQYKNVYLRIYVTGFIMWIHLLAKFWTPVIAMNIIKIAIKDISTDVFFNLLQQMLIVICDQVKSRMDVECSMQGRDEKCVKNFGRKTWREEAIRKT
jgi:hypothetical protein